MGWIIFESMVALGLGLFIVWWTMGSRRKSKPRDERTGGGPDEGRPG